jgi:hypothetical protein
MGPTDSGTVITPIDEDIRYYRFLFEEYRPACWYWECFPELVKRMFFMAVLPMIPDGSAFKHGIVVVVALVYLQLYRLYKPFHEDRNNIMVELACAKIILLTVLSLLREFNDYNWSPYQMLIYDWLYVLVMSGLTCYLLAILCDEFHIWTNFLDCCKLVRRLVCCITLENDRMTEASVSSYSNEDDDAPSPRELAAMQQQQMVLKHLDAQTRLLNRLFSQRTLDSSPRVNRDFNFAKVDKYQPRRSTRKYRYSRQYLNDVETSRDSEEYVSNNSEYETDSFVDGRHYRSQISSFHHGFPPTYRSPPPAPGPSRANQLAGSYDYRQHQIPGSQHHRTKSVDRGGSGSSTSRQYDPVMSSPCDTPSNLDIDGIYLTGKKADEGRRLIYDKEVYMRTLDEDDAVSIRSTRMLSRLEAHELTTDTTNMPVPAVSRTQSMNRTPLKTLKRQLTGSVPPSSKLTPPVSLITEIAAPPASHLSPGSYRQQTILKIPVQGAAARTRQHSGEPVISQFPYIVHASKSSQQNTAVNIDKKNAGMSLSTACLTDLSSSYEAMASGTVVEPRSDSLTEPDFELRYDTDSISESAHRVYSTASLPLVAATEPLPAPLELAAAARTAPRFLTPSIYTDRLKATNSVAVPSQQCTSDSPSGVQALTAMQSVRLLCKEKSRQLLNYKTPLDGGADCNGTEIISEKGMVVNSEVQKVDRRSAVRSDVRSVGEYKLSTRGSKQATNRATESLSNLKVTEVDVCTTNDSVEQIIFEGEVEGGGTYTEELTASHELLYPIKTDLFIVDSPQSLNHNSVAKMSLTGETFIPQTNKKLDGLSADAGRRKQNRSGFLGKEQRAGEFRLASTTDLPSAYCHEIINVRNAAQLQCLQNASYYPSPFISPYPSSHAWRPHNQLLANGQQAPQYYVYQPYCEGQLELQQYIGNFEGTTTHGNGRLLPLSFDEVSESVAVRMSSPTSSVECMPALGLLKVHRPQLLITEINDSHEELRNPTRGPGIHCHWLLLTKTLDVSEADGCLPVPILSVRLTCGGKVSLG